jgi:hypothetical protein
MRRWLVVVSVLFLLGTLTSEVWAASVRGYYRKDGTYVQPHQRTNPDGNPFNNYSFPGNYNPNIGKVTPGDPQRYLDRYYGGQGNSGYGSQGSSGRPGTYQNPFDVRK